MVKKGVSSRSYRKQFCSCKVTQISPVVTIAFEKEYFPLGFVFIPIWCCGGIPGYFQQKNYRETRKKYTLSLNCTRYWRRKSGNQRRLQSEDLFLEITLYLGRKSRIQRNYDLLILSKLVKIIIISIVDLITLIHINTQHHQ